MNKPHWANALITHNDKLIAAVLCFGIVLAPLAFNPHALLPYEHLQVMVWRSCIAISAGLLALRLLFNGNYIAAKSYRTLWIALAVLVSSAALSTLLSVSPTVAWWGSSYRFQGLFTSLHYLAGAIIIMIGIEKKYIAWILRAIIFSGTVVSVWAIGQRLGLDPWAFPVRVFGSFGHPNFLAAFLVMTALVTIGSLQGKYRWLVTVTLYIQITAMFLTFTRTAWVAYLVPALFILIVIWWKRAIFHSKLPIFIATAICLTVVLSYASARFINRNAQYAYAVFSSTSALSFVLEDAEQTAATTNPLDDRVRSITNLQEGSMMVRWYIWQDSIEVIKAYPWLGIGQDTLSIIYPEFYRAEPNRPAIAKSTYTDRAHNEILDLLVNYGVIGLVSWLACYAIIALTILRSLKKMTDPTSVLIMTTVGSSIMSYWLFNLLGFAVTMTSALFWVGVGIVYRYSSTTETAPKINNLNISYKPVIACIGIVGLSLFIIQTNVFPAIASYYGYQAIRPGITTLAAEGYLRRSLALAPTEQRYEVLLAETYLTNAQATTNLSDRGIWLKQARQSAQRAADLGLDHLAYWALMVRIYDLWPDRDYGQTEKQRYEEKIHTLIPYFGETYEGA